MTALFRQASAEPQADPQPHRDNIGKKNNIIPRRLGKAHIKLHWQEVGAC